MNFTHCNRWNCGAYSARFRRVNYFVYAREIFHFRTKTKKFLRHVFSPHAPCVFGLRTAIRRQSRRMLETDCMQSNHRVSYTT
ncbi:DUF1661 domain-containing protein [Porphyromonas gingivalis]|uniref:DUF1661 domain-containing protein n=1 Tax=Porphyromonas gingivalis TaxID=837 RepID=UPI00118755C9|nr:DUF1661 domain-containing protein [Porphyromonas gingivalis]MCE8193030.1 DUF1661 domain-containing protein [Porphyromonas gingivalis]